MGDLNIIDILGLWFIENDKRFSYHGNVTDLFKCTVCSRRRIYIFGDEQAVVFDNGLTGRRVDIGDPSFFIEISEYIKHDCEQI